MTSKVVGVTDNVFINPWLIVGVQLLTKTLQDMQKWVWVALLPGLYCLLQYSGQNAGSAQYNLLPSILSVVYLYFSSLKCFSTMLELWPNLLGRKNGWVHSRGRSPTVVSVQVRSTWTSRGQPWVWGRWLEIQQMWINTAVSGKQSKLILINCFMSRSPSPLASCYLF